MYREKCSIEKQQISLEKTSKFDAILVALAEGTFFKKSWLYIKKKFLFCIKCIKLFPRFIDELLGTGIRYLILCKKQVINNRIAFGTFQNSYTCNCKYIAEKIIEKNIDCEMIFIVNKDVYENRRKYQIPEQIKLVKRNSLESFLVLGTSKIWIDNALNCIWKSIPKKKEQIYINTWHGSLGIKRLNGNRRWRWIAKHGNNVIDYFITDSEFEEGVFHNSFWPDVEQLKCGHPRNDIFFDENKMYELKKKVYDFYEIDMNVKTVLYAPTFRENKSDSSAIAIDCEKLKNALENKFGGEWQVITRLHYHNANNKKTKNTFQQTTSIDASKYLDMQELMAAVDIGITDYSSWIFDFALTKKPAFIYAKDIEKYIDSRGFYYSLNETPFAISDCEEQLFENINLFDMEEYRRRVERFLEEKGCYEAGNASEQIVEFICEKIII